MQPGHQTYPCGEGTVEIDADGFVVGARHPAHPGLDALLTPRTAPWFGRESGWGTGFLLSSAGSGRFVRPESLEFSADGTTSAYTPVDGLRLTVERTFGDRWRERYRLRNRRDVPVTIGSFAIHTPIADTYGPAATVLRERLHAHVWTGGAESWLVGVRMDGTPPAFVLDLTEGELWAYSLGGRNQFTSSNIRGVVALHATDHARAPHAFGGQPILELAPGEELVLGWEIGWYDDVDAALSGHRATVTASTLAAPIGTPVVIGAGSGADTVVESGRHGVSHIDVMVGGGRRARVAVLHHTPVDELVSRRVDALLDRHRAVERDGTRAAAFVPYDVERGLRLTHDLGWSDWSDSRERVGMPLLLLAARARGWCRDVTAVDSALRAYRVFCRERLVTPDHHIRNSSTADGHPRLYNNPWFAYLFAELYAAYGEESDLCTAVAILDRYYADGGHRFLAILVAEAVHRVAALCDRAGWGKDAARLRDELVRHGRTLVELGTDLPAHEVMYEQSMTAPLLSILMGAWRLEPSEELETTMRTVLPWLTAFAGRQPHVRLRNVPIRHWDGYWFGRLRLWGDTFPHYWSILSPRALLDWPDEVEAPTPHTDRFDETIRDVTAANLIDFTPDGNASCAFVLPSCVDDRPGYVADPLANDQDMGLALTLLGGTSGRAPVSVLT